MHDKLPNSICEECETNIDKLYNFRKIIQNSDLELKKHLQVLEDTKAISQSSYELQMKNEHCDLRNESRADIVNSINVANDKTKVLQQLFTEDEPTDLFCDLPEADDSSSESETSVEPFAKEATVLCRKSNDKDVLPQKLKVIT